MSLHSSPSRAARSIDRDLHRSAFGREVASTDPDRWRCRGPWMNPGGLEVVELAMVSDLVLGEQPPNQSDGLFEPSGSGPWVNSQRLLFLAVPANARDNPQPAFTEKLELGELFGHQHGMPQRDQHDRSG